MPTLFEKPLALKIQNLSKKYMLKDGKKKGDYIVAVDNLSLDVYKGEVIGIIGPNGSGKSTLLKIISEVTAPDSGFVETYGKVASILEVGTGFNPDLSGRKNIYLNARLHGMKKEEVDAKLDNIVELFGFPRFLDTPVKKYSSGMYMRLAFAIVVHIDADIYLFDEVLSVGDIAFRKKIIQLIRNMQHDGKTIIIVTHNPGFIVSICNNMLLLIEGKIKIYDITNNVMAQYKKILFNYTSNGNQIINTNSRNEKELSDLKQTLYNINTENQFDIIKASVTNQGNSSDCTIYGHKEINFEFECSYKTEQRLQIAFAIMNMEGTVISTHIFDSPPSGENKITAKMTFPPNTFTDAVSIIDVFVLFDELLSILYQNIFIFNVKSKDSHIKALGNYYVSHINLPVDKSIISIIDTH